MAAPEDADCATWLVLVYQLPAEPAGLRALVRRKLTAAGAVYLSRACAVAPVGRTERVMRRMRATIADAGGTAMLLRAAALGGEEQIIAAMEATRDREHAG
jgi:DNA-binding transcriptional regulator PaaX